MTTETAFNMASSNLRFGKGATSEIGMELADMEVKHVLLVTDPILAALPPVTVALQALHDEKIRYTLFDQARIEPTDDSLRQAITFANEHPADAFVAIGGGSVIDTAKAANLYSSCPADFLDYVNAPIGKAKPIPAPLRPLIAIPTTAGTGSETTGVLIFDLVEMHAKTGIAGLRLKPTLGLLDPDNTKTLPSQVAACTGLDVLTHAVESYTAISFDQREKPQRPLLRPAYQGSNPISDTWSLQALRMVAEFLQRAVQDPSDDEARGMMLLAAAYAGMGFGNAGVHLAHGMSYPVSGMVRDYKPDGYEVDHAIVPHGMSVVINAPAVFRFTAQACPQRHLEAAGALGADIDNARLEDAGRILADRIIEFMQVLNIPNGLAAIGFSSNEIPALVEGTLPQHRVTKLSPRPVGAEELAELFQDAMSYW